ncbi:hypothetical protein CKAH01_07523 [Colletotrichum kahawae]|uniref:Uncharacterized protein n=1 Tax=Colletotrichum kahawae TaxID=34407 RepID=A0AAD9Y5F0_COLKA|nr:hypothetical protein CKAH01_07523 [Colletotrichum kahawae]
MDSASDPETKLSSFYLTSLQLHLLPKFRRPTETSSNRSVSSTIDPRLPMAPRWPYYPWQTQVQPSSAQLFVNESSNASSGTPADQNHGPFPTQRSSSGMSHAQHPSANHSLRPGYTRPRRLQQHFPLPCPRFRHRVQSPLRWHVDNTGV